MKVMKPIVVMFCAVLAVFATLSFSVDAAQVGAKTPGKEADSLRPSGKTKPEIDDFNAMASMKDPAAVLAASDAFIAKFQSSQLMGEVRGLRMAAYLSQKKFNEAIAELDKALLFNDAYLADKIKEAPAQEKNSSKLQDLARYRDTTELDYYRRVLDAAQAAQNVKLTIGVGDRILAKVPMDVPTLMTVARVVAQKPPADAEEKAKALDGAEEYAQYAVYFITTFLNSPNSAGLKPEERAEWNYRAHALMGLIYNQRQSYDDAVKAYRVALSYKKNDGVAYYYLGFAYYSAKKYDEAIDAALKSAFLKGPLEQGARDLLDGLYRLAKKDRTTIEKDIQAAGQSLLKL